MGSCIIIRTYAAPKRAAPPCPLVPAVSCPPPRQALTPRQTDRQTDRAPSACKACLPVCLPACPCGYPHCAALHEARLHQPTPFYLPWLRPPTQPASHPPTPASRPPQPFHPPTQQGLVGGAALEVGGQDGLMGGGRRHVHNVQQHTPPRKRTPVQWVPATQLAVQACRSSVARDA